MFKDLKYLFAYSTPIIVLWGFFIGGHWTFSGAYWAFVLIPIFELFVRASDKNLPEESYISRSKNRIFDILLYLNVPIVWGLYVYFLFLLDSGSLSGLEIRGMITSMGVILGTLGINVAHELGHREKKFERILALSLLLPNYYMHFHIEHNRGHHKHVATKRDPASSRKNESIYTFWFRSIIGSYIHAWKLENQRLGGFKIMHNYMVYYTIIQLLLTACVLFCFGWFILLCAINAALVGVILLESVNYIEHYGLTRKKISESRYEPVGASHSWNSDHEIGRIVLYELVRHSDHHVKTNRKYQSLRSLENAPQLPAGYPGSIILSLLPPLWFKIMNKRIPTT